MKACVLFMKKYEIIYKELERQILAQTWAAGDYLPTEHELARRYDASRDTVRKALKLLAEDGLVQATQGKGTQVQKREQIHFPVSELTSYSELVTQLGMASRTILLSIDKVLIDEHSSQLTGLPLRALAWRIKRKRVVDGVAAVIDTDYLLKSLVPDMSREIAEQSIYAYLENQLGLNIALAQKEITIEQVQEDDRLQLDLGKDHHLVSVKSKTFLADGRQFQFTESRHKLDKFKFVDLSKRKRLN